MCQIGGRRVGEGGKGKDVARGEERETSGSDVPGCASGSGREEVSERKKGEKQRKRRAY